MFNICYNIKIWSKENTHDEIYGCEIIYLISNYGINYSRDGQLINELSRLRLTETSQPIHPFPYSRQLASTGNLTTTKRANLDKINVLFKLNPF